jgi:hypothetical protein
MRAEGSQLGLAIRRLEFNPPLPTTWFDADAPDFDTSFPSFDNGIPTPPLDPGFYAPMEEEPPPDGGQPLPPAPGQTPPAQPPPPPPGG